MMLTSHDALLSLLKPRSDDRTTFIPQFFRLDAIEDVAHLRELLKLNPQMTVVDTLAAQVAELIKTRNASERFTPAELQDRVQAHFGAVRPQQFGVWVYYPWSQHLVHLLDEVEFIELRTNRNCYKITPDEQRQLATKKVGVIGLSVGKSAAITMAMERGFGEIRLADFDTIDLSNLNHLCSSLENIGLPKALIAAREIAQIDPFLKVTCFLDGINEANIDAFLTDSGKIDLLVEECDGMDVKFLARYRARALGIPVIMDTSDRGMLDVERFDLDPSRPILHGLVENVDYKTLRGLSNEEKIPIVLKIVGVETMSKRMKASLIEVEESLYTWPQLASSVMLGGALTADIGRRILLNQFHSSGRYFVDMEDLVRDPDPLPAIHESVTAVTPLTPEDMYATAEMVLQIDPVPAFNAELTPNQIEELVGDGILAPSGGNCQPWKWLYQERRLFLFHDEQRSASFLDFENSASYTALGAATENVILKAHDLGLSVRCQFFPLGLERRLVTLFGFSTRLLPLSESHLCDPLVYAIPIRTTNRRLGPRRPIPQDDLDLIQQVVRTLPGAELHLVSSASALAKGSRILGAVERLRLLHPESHHDMMSELRWTREEAKQTGDGIDLETMELSAIDRAAMNVGRDWAVLEWISKWERGAALSKLVHKAVDASTCLGLITMPDAQPTSYVLGGRAMQRAWLAANESNIAFQPLSSITYLFARLIHGNGSGMSAMMLSELTDLRQSYLDLFGIEEGIGEILLFRLAVVGSPTTYALRRPVGDVLVPTERT